jgi:hypothetical protein
VSRLKVWHVVILWVTDADAQRVLVHALSSQAVRLMIENSLLSCVTRAISINLRTLGSFEKGSQLGECEGAEEEERVSKQGYGRFDFSRLLEVDPVITEYGCCFLSYAHSHIDA